MAALTTIEGIGEALAAKLKAAGATTIESLLSTGSTPAGRKALAEASGIDDKRLLRFINHADLMRVNGVGGEYAELLEAAGVDTIPELKMRNAQNLWSKMEAVNADRKLVRKLPAQSLVENWVAQAKSLPRVIEY